MVIVRKEVPWDVVIRFRYKLLSFFQEVIFKLKPFEIELLGGYHL